MRVPRVTERQVRRTPLPNARQRLSVSPDTFGAQSARRLSQTARGLTALSGDLGRIALDRVRQPAQQEDAKDQEAQKAALLQAQKNAEQQALRSEADAEQGYARLLAQATELLAGFQRLQGQEAVAAYDGALARLNALPGEVAQAISGGDVSGGGMGGEVGGGAGNERAKALFAQQALNRLPAFQAVLDRHRERQLSSYRATAAQARMDSAVAAALTDPELIPGALAEIAAVAAQQGEALEVSTEALAETVAETVRGQTSRIHFGRVEQLLSQGQSAAALAHLEDYGGQMTEADRAQLELKAAEAARRDEVLAGYRAIAAGSELLASLRRRPDAPGEAPDSPERPGPVETSELPDATRAEARQAPGLSLRVLRAQAAATAQAEAQAGSPQAGLHRGYLAQLDRLATAGLAEPEIQGRIAELLTADYEAEVAARREAKATALQEVYRGLRDGDYRPAGLPPDLAVLLSEAERAEIEAWWQGGLAVAPDAALFEGLIALPPDALLALDLSRPALARRLSESETARLQSLQAELRRQRGRTPTAGGDGIGGEAEGREAGGGAEALGASLTELNATLEALGVGVGGGTASDGAMNETAPDLWGVNRRRVGSLPEGGDPRETQVAVGIFGGDEGGEGSEGGGREGEGPEEGEDKTDDALPLDTAPLDAFEIDEDAAGELDRIGRELSERTGLSDEEIEAYGREILKLVPGLGEALSAQDAFEAFRTAQEALGDRDLYAALEAAALGFVELAGAAPVVGKLARLGKIGLRAAWDMARGSRFRRTLAIKRKQEAERGVDVSDEEVARRLREDALRGARSFRKLQAGMGGRIEKPNGVRAELDYTDQSVEHIELLHRAVEDVSPINAEAVSGLIDGGRLTTSRGAHDHVINVDRGGGPTEATEAFHRAIENAGGNLNEIVPNDEEGQRWTAPDGTTYERYESKRNKDTVVIVIPSPRAPNRDGLWNIKIRFRGQP